MEIHYEVKGLKIEPYMLVLEKVNQPQGGGGSTSIKVSLKMKIGSQVIEAPVSLSRPPDTVGDPVPKLKAWVETFGGELVERPLEAWL